MRYEVFTRINPGDDLVHVGSVIAPSDKLAKNYARTTYDEESWAYMILARRDDLIKAIGGSEEAIEVGELQ